MTTIWKMPLELLRERRDALRRELDIHQENNNLDIEDVTDHWSVIQEVYENQIRKYQEEIDRRKL